MTGVMWRRLAMYVTAATAIAALALGTASTSAGRSRAMRASSAAAACANPDLSDPRNPSNPLDLPTAPGFDPLHGAHFMVAGPAHGTVAKGIEMLIGDHTKYADTDTWESFRTSLLSGPLASLAGAKLAEVKLLIKIGDQEETNNLSEYSMGGGYAALKAQTLKINCVNMLADPPGDAASGDAPAGVSRAPLEATTDMNPTIPVFSTFFWPPNGNFCPSLGQLQQWEPTFKQDIMGMAAGQGLKRAVDLLEIDSIGASHCIKGAALKLFEYLLRFEIEQMTALPHTVVYQEAGSSDEDSPSYVAHILHDICVEYDATLKRMVNRCALMRGFWSNATHSNWDSEEVPWADQVSKLLDQAIFASTGTHYMAFHVINTAINGRGPVRPKNRRKYGNELLCNPRGLGLGRQPTANTMPTFDGMTLDGTWYRHILDAFLWSGVPGRSHNAHCPGGPWAPAGVFDPRFAEMLAANANQQFGPGYPSLPY
jgi:hypothetical protein